MLGLVATAGTPIAALRASTAFDHRLRASGSLAIAGTALGRSAATGRSGSHLPVAPAGSGAAIVIAGAAQVLPLVGASAAPTVTRGYVGGSISWQGAAAGTGLSQGRAHTLFGFPCAAQALTAGRGQLRVELLGSGALPLSCYSAGEISNEAVASGITALPGALGGTLAIRASVHHRVTTSLATQAAAGISGHLAAQAPAPFGAGAAATAIVTSSAATLWLTDVRARGFRAPPALRRDTIPDQPQGGILAPSLRSGRLSKG